jgi:hypothetical protein
MRFGTEAHLTSVRRKRPRPAVGVALEALAGGTYEAGGNAVATFALADIGSPFEPLG